MDVASLQCRIERPFGFYHACSNCSSDGRSFKVAFRM
jgi:hypothetical protein